MSAEFDIDAFLRDNLPGESDKPVSIILPSHHVLSLGIYLQVQVSLRGKMFNHGEVDLSQRIIDLEDSIALLADRVDETVQDEYTPQVCFEVSRRELDDLGAELLGSTRSSGRALFNTGFRKPVYDAFLALDDGFVKSGGQMNEDLRREMENKLKTIK